VWTVSLGEATELLRVRHGISRQRQDEFTVCSHQLAERCWSAICHDDLVVGVLNVNLVRDESVRSGSTVKRLAGLATVFRCVDSGETVTSGNASPLTDGARGAVLGSANAQGIRGLTSLAQVAGRGASAREPQYFGFAAVQAANTALRHAGIGCCDVSAMALNKAFAAPSLARIHAWKVDPEIVNRHRGAPAISHPLGSSGAWILGTLAPSSSSRGSSGGGGHLHRCLAGSRRGPRERRGPRTVMVHIVKTVDEAVADIPDGATVMIGGLGTAGQPVELIEALVRHGSTDLIVVNNNAGNGDVGLASLVGAGRVRKIVCSFPRQFDSHHFDAKSQAGEIELELIPQGNLAERIHAAGAGIGGFFTPTGYGTPVAQGKETREIEGKHCVLEFPIRADFALIKAHVGDEVGNLTYRKTARNFGPIIASAPRTAIVQVSHIVPVGQIDPENVVTPGIHTRRIVPVPAVWAPEPEAGHRTRRAGLVTTSWPRWSQGASRRGHTSTLGSASRLECRTSSHPAVGSRFTPRMACSGWGHRLTAMRSTST
jgi:3-oxoadipate CoA-transferase, alpha subunit